MLLSISQSLDRRKARLIAARRHSRAKSTGALNLAHLDHLQPGGGGGLFGGFSGRGVSLMRGHATSPAILHYGDSKISLGQISDHIDKYRDVAL